MSLPLASAKFERQTALSFALTLFCGGDRGSVVARRILRGFVEAVGFGERDAELTKLTQTSIK